MEPQRRKAIGAYYTPDDVVRTLVNWALASPSDRMLDPSCGDGRFLTIHPNSVGVEEDALAAAVVHARAPGSLIHQGDFFSWAGSTLERFECAAGNPPFIRYQRFTGETRAIAQSICARHGAVFNSLASSWAPFLVATATLLKPGGRMAFVVPAEIGHAPYAAPLLWYLMNNFSTIQIVAVREKLFPDLSEDCWLLFCNGFGGKSDSILLSEIGHFTAMDRPPRLGRRVSADELEHWRSRLRPFLAPASALELYERLSQSPLTSQLSEVAKLGIGYVTGANDFFHLRPSIAEQLEIPKRFLTPAVRNGRDLIGPVISNETVSKWWKDDEPNFLLQLNPTQNIPAAISKYLESPEGVRARETYKCRNRTPWYAVPDVKVPDAFLSYMSGSGPSLVANEAGCVGANSVHVMHLKRGVRLEPLQQRWSDPLTQLSCELEGHPLGGGMLKVEPGEAKRILVRRKDARDSREGEILMEGACVMRRWRHHG